MERNKIECIECRGRHSVPEHKTKDEQHCKLSVYYQFLLFLIKCVMFFLNISQEYSYHLTYILMKSSSSETKSFKLNKIRKKKNKCDLHKQKWSSLLLLFLSSLYNLHCDIRYSFVLYCIGILLFGNEGMSISQQLIPVVILCCSYNFKNAALNRKNRCSVLRSEMLMWFTQNSGHNLLANMIFSYSKSFFCLEP